MRGQTRRQTDGRTGGQATDGRTGGLKFMIFILSALASFMCVLLFLCIVRITFPTWFTCVARYLFHLYVENGRCLHRLINVFSIIRPPCFLQQKVVGHLFLHA